MLHPFFPESMVVFPHREYRVAEDIGEVLIPVQRTGDLTDELTVICTTQSGKGHRSELSPIHTL